jgi:hypothetical protein
MKQILDLIRHQSLWTVTCADWGFYGLYVGKYHKCLELCILV